MQLVDTRAVITGGLSGLGFAVAQHLVDQGGKVALFDINDAKAETALLKLGHENAAYFRTDVSNETQVTENIRAAHAFMGGINTAVNCAGILGAGRVLGREASMPLEQFSNTIKVNLIGSFNIAKAAATSMQHNLAGEDGERGVIINTASVAAYDGQIGQAAYSASKGGVVAMTLPMARELARFGIRVMTIAPGIFWTPMVDSMTPQVQESLSTSIPFPARLGKPEEFAQTVAFILQNRYMNGETIRLDGSVRLTAK